MRKTIATIILTLLTITAVFGAEIESFNVGADNDSWQLVELSRDAMERLAENPKLYHKGINNWGQVHYLWFADPNDIWTPVRDIKQGVLYIDIFPNDIELKIIEFEERNRYLRDN